MCFLLFKFLLLQVVLSVVWRLVLNFQVSDSPSSSSSSSALSSQAKAKRERSMFILLSCDLSERSLHCSEELCSPESRSKEHAPAMGTRQDTRCERSEY